MVGRYRRRQGCCWSWCLLKSLENCPLGSAEKHQNQTKIDLWVFCFLANISLREVIAGTSDVSWFQHNASLTRNINRIEVEDISVVLKRCSALVDPRKEVPGRGDPRLFALECLGDEEKSFQD